MYEYVTEGIEEDDKCVCVCVCERFGIIALSPKQIREELLVHTGFPGFPWALNLMDEVLNTLSCNQN